MPTNTQVTAAIIAGTVPPDLNCPRDGQAIVDLVAMVNTVAISSTESSGSTGDSVAQQALQVANLALSTAQQALNAIPQTRSSEAPISIPTGDAAFPISWSPAMPDANYEVRGTYFGTSAFPSAYYGFHVEDGTRTVNGCTLRLNNTPANFKFAWVAQQLPSS